MSESGVLQLRQTDFSRFENYQTRLQGKYKLTIVSVAVGHPTQAANQGTTTYQVDIQQLQGKIDNRSGLFFIYSLGKVCIPSPITFAEVYINGQFTFSGLNMGVLTDLIITIQYEKCD
jgi:hypothetical protein